jgi:SAM-dependent methyltransferase
MSADLFLPAGYRRNERNEAFVDIPSSLTYQPHVYALAARCAEAARATRVIDLGCGSGRKLSLMPSGTRISVYDLHPDEAGLRAQLPDVALEVHRCDFERAFPRFSDEELADAVVICADVVEHLREPAAFLSQLATIGRRCRYLFLSTPARDRARGAGDLGPPANPAHCQEWTLAEFVLLARSCGLRVPLHGYTWNTDHHGWKSTILAIDGRDAVPAPASLTKPPLAIVKSFNDEDFIAHCIGALRREGLSVHLIDNWSSDRTFAIASDLAAADPCITVERFPEAPSTDYPWKQLLDRTVAVAEARGPGWYMHVDSDEIRESPWADLRLADALAHVDACGYNAIDFTVIDFRYLVGEVLDGPPWDVMRYFEFGRRPGHFQQVKAWKSSGQPVDLSSSGGHDARFASRRVFPLKFLLRHYPLRGPEHARRKIFEERLPRSERERAERGWHVQYVGISPDRLDGWRRHELVAWHPVTFQTDYLVERLSGIGLRD